MRLLKDGAHDQHTLVENNGLTDKVLFFIRSSQDIKRLSALPFKKMKPKPKPQCPEGYRIAEGSQSRAMERLRGQLSGLDFHWSQCKELPFTSHSLGFQ